VVLHANQPWQNWIRKFDSQLNVTPIPVAIRALVPSLTAKPELCISCHVGIEDISAAHPAETFGYIICRGGEPLALDKDRAHSTLRGGRNPSDLSIAGQSCELSNCHGGYPDEEQNHVDRIMKSIQATYVGGIAVVRYAFGAQKSQAALFGIHSISDPNKNFPRKALGPLAMFPSALGSGSIDVKLASCLNGGCHLWTNPPRPQPYMCRSSGCAACHYLYADDGLYRGNDPTIPRSDPGHGLARRLTTAIPYSQCDHCHNRGNYSLKTMLFDFRDALPQVRGRCRRRCHPTGDDCGNTTNRSRSLQNANMN
jgi:hypothetical protein